MARKVPRLRAAGAMIGEVRRDPRTPTPYPDRMQLPVPVKRLGYRVAYAGLRTYWFVRRPKLSGVKCVLTDGDEVLLVRHTYGPRAWDLPGGAIKRGEAPLHAASREMNEELGVSIDDWRALGAVRVIVDHRRDLVHCF